MQRLILSIAGFAFAVGIAVAAPAQPRYEPKDPPKAPTAVRVDLAGTAWIGKYGAAVRTFVFEADGTVSYRSGTAAALKARVIQKRGFWKLQGNTLYFEHYINPQNKLIEFRGTVTDANTIIGEQIMLQTGQKLNVTMQRMNLDTK